MGRLKKEIEIFGTKKSKKVEALLNSGAFRNYIRREFANKEKVDDLGFYTVEKEYKVFLADGTERKGIRARFKGIKIEDCVYNIKSRK